MVTDERLSQMVKGLALYAKSKFGISINEFSSKDLYPAMAELQARRQSELKPATKFLTNTFEQQLLQVHEEIDEIEDAFELYKYPRISAEQAKKDLALEIVDGMTALRTLAKICGISETELTDAMAAVRQKNSKRLYYREEKK